MKKYIYACDMTTDCIWWETSSHFTSQDSICNILFVTAFTRTNQWCCLEPNAEVKTFSCTSTPHNPPMVLCSIICCDICTVGMCSYAML